MKASDLSVIDPADNETLSKIEQADKIGEAELWNHFETKFRATQKDAELVLKSDPTLATSVKNARALRLSLKELRCAIENERKSLGESYLRKKQDIDTEAKRIKELIEPYEEKLLAIEQHAERAEAERIRVLTQERTTALVAIGGASTLDLGRLEESQWQDMLNGATLVNEQKLAQAEKDEEDHIAKEKAEAEERERIRLENEKLKQEAIEAARISKEQQDRADAEKKALETKLEQERIAAEKIRQEEREKERKSRAAELEKHQKEQDALKEKARVEREAFEKKVAQERAVRNKLEKENAEREAAAAKIKSDAEKAKKNSESAPDKQKLKSFAESVRALQVPEFTTESGKTVGADIAAKVQGFAKWIEAKTIEL